MTIQYWQAREDEILAFRDYALSFDLNRDLAEGAWLAESGTQLLEIAFQLFFLGRSGDCLQLAAKAVEYCLAALIRESPSPMTDPAMAHVYHRLYYGRWWVTGQEPIGLLRQAATAYSARLAQPPSVDDAAAYARAAWLWLELGETAPTNTWLNLAEWAEEQSGSRSADGTLARRVVDQCLSEGHTTARPCEALDGAIAAATAWDQPSGGTLWDALQLANVRRRVLRQNQDFPGLLMEIR